jgi:hypothetical protein
MLTNLKLTNIEIKTADDDANLDPGFGQTEKFGEVKPCNEITPFPLDVQIFIIQSFILEIK